MTATNKRAAAMARDLVDRLTTDKAIAKKGTYAKITIGDFKRVFGFLKGSPDIRETAEKTNAQEHIDAFQPYCEACALGNFWMSKIRIEDKVTVAEMFTDDDLEFWIDRTPSNPMNAIRPDAERILDDMAETFGMEQRIMIESAFEMRDLRPDHYKLDPLDDEDTKHNDSLERIRNTDVHRAIAFGMKYEKGDKARLLAIAQNMLQPEHLGVFDPPADPDFYYDFSDWTDIVEPYNEDDDEGEEEEDEEELDDDENEDSDADDSDDDEEEDWNK